MKKYQISFTIFFLFLLFVLIIPKRIFAERTNEQFASSVSSCSSKWINILNSLGNPDSNYASIDLEIPTCIWNFTESFNIPPNSTLNSLTAKIYASNSGTTGVSSMSPTFNTIQVCTPPPFFPAILTNGITEYVVTAANCSGFPSVEKINSPNMGWRFFNSGKVRLSIDAVSLVIDYSPAPIPTPTPEPGPEPFLDLPWDYSTTGKSFDDLALNPNSWFDHEYPLQDTPCCILSALNFAGNYGNSYKSHNGYDYGAKHGIKLDTSVKAAAAGIATFVDKNNSGGAGNTIKIDHGNGYQTWYEHLSDNYLIISDESEQAVVKKGDVIGKVGMTGNTTGPHIHFSVVKDSNENADFNDDYPFGLVDPLGWDSENDDPWELWEENGRLGTKSYNLFIENATPKPEIIFPSGGQIVYKNLVVNVPPDAYNGTLNVEIKNGPFSKNGELLKSVIPSTIIKAVSSLNQPVSTFLFPIELIFNYSNADLTNINESTLSVYYYDDQLESWVELPTVINFDEKSATVLTNHFSQFALMGQQIDTDPPLTTVTLNGKKGEDNWYNSSVSAILNSEDNINGVGIAETIHTIDNINWLSYSNPITFTTEGGHNIWYMSYDLADNKEKIKQTTFLIDMTLPKVNVEVSDSVLWPPNNKLIPIKIEGNATDENLSKTEVIVKDEYNEFPPIITNFGETVNLKASRKGNDKDGRTYTITASAIDKAGNVANAETKVVVPQNDSKLKDFLLALLLRLIRGIN